jgi:cation diffusion facilitator family transporter
MSSDKRSGDVARPLSNYGTVAACDGGHEKLEQRQSSAKHHHSIRKSLASLKDVSSRVAFVESTRSHHLSHGHSTGSLASLKDVSSRVAFMESTRSHHHPHGQSTGSLASPKDVSSRVAFIESSRSHHHPHGKSTSVDYSTVKSSSLDSPFVPPPSSDSDDDGTSDHEKAYWSGSNLRKIALDLSLWINIFILITKVIAYLETLSLSVLAALVDSILDVVSQWILSYTEKRSSKTRSSAHYPAGASRLEPLGVLSCAALMGFASFGVLKEALEKLYEGVEHGSGKLDENWSSFWSMLSVVLVKIGLWVLCRRVGNIRIADAAHNQGTRGSVETNTYCVDSTMEALAQDHWNDCLSNAVAAIALLCTLSDDNLWILDPIGAIIISIYIIFSWYSTGKEQIEQLTGKAAPRVFIDELYETASNFDPKMEVSGFSIG